MQNKRFDTVEKEQKKKLPKWAFFLILFGASVLLFIIGSLIAKNEATSFLGDIIAFPASLGTQVFPIILIVYLIKAIVRATRKKLVSERKAPREVTYNEIHYSGDVDEKKTVLKRFSYNKNDILRLGKNAQPLYWGFVVMFLLFLFPMGLFFMIKKVHYEKTRYFDNGVNMIITGGFFTGVALPIVVLLSYPWHDLSRENIILASLPLIVAIFGVILIIAGMILRRKGKINEYYMSLIVNERITNIREIAKRGRTTYSKASERIQKLIDADFLSGAYIYHRDKEVIVPGVSKKIAVYCKNCGGTTVLYANDKRECDYCGARI